MDFIKAIFGKIRASLKNKKGVDPSLPLNEQIKQAGAMCRLRPDCPHGRCYEVPSSGFYCTCDDSLSCKVKDTHPSKCDFSMEFLDDFIEWYCVAKSNKDFVRKYDILKYFNPNGVIREAALSGFIEYMVEVLTPGYEFSKRFFERAIYCNLTSDEEYECQYYVDIPVAIVKGCNSKEQAETYGNLLFDMLENSSSEEINSGAVPLFWHDYLREPSLYDRDTDDFVYTLISFSSHSNEGFVESHYKDPSVVDLKQFYDSEGRIKPGGKDGVSGDTIYQTTKSWFGLK